MSHVGNNRLSVGLSINVRVTPRADPVHAKGASMVVSHSIFDFQAPEIDLRNDALRCQLFEIMRKYQARGPVVSTELEDGKSCLFIFVGKDGG